MNLEFTVGEHTYRAGKLNAKQQFHILRRLGPVITRAGQIGEMSWDQVKEKLGNLLTAIQPMADVLSEMDDAPLDYIIDTCLSVCMRKVADERWTPVWNKSAQKVMFEDLGMADMLQIVANVLREAVAGFFPYAAPISDGAPRAA